MHAMTQTMREQGTRPSRAELLAMFCETATEVVEKDFHHVLETSVISELAIVKSNWGFPFNATISRPPTVKLTVITDPTGPGPALPARMISVIFAPRIMFT